MKDPVALAWSGRVAEAWDVAREQAGRDDAFVAAQGLEALAVLGAEHGYTSEAALDAVLAKAALETSLSRRAFEAAMRLRSRALEPVSTQLLTSGEARWEVLRYAGELPSDGLAKALAEGWDRLPARLRDEALLTACAMPASTKAEREAWGARALRHVGEVEESVRVAAFRALRTFAHKAGAKACAQALDDGSEAVRAEAATTLLALDPKLAIAQAAERGEACVELWSRLTPEQRASARDPA